MNLARQTTQDIYRKYYENVPEGRNDLLVNPEVLFQYLACEVSVLTVLKRAKLDRESAKILDVGCGGGGSLTRFVQLGFHTHNLHGIDIMEERIEEAKKRYPNLRFTCDSATSMPYESNTFDLVLESTMFTQMTDEKMAHAIAEEMLRVTKPSGYLLLIDWRYSKPWDASYVGLPKKRLHKLFSVGPASRIVRQESGALIPPIGRRLSKYLPSAYFTVKAVFPFLVGQKATLLQKTATAR